MHPSESRSRLPTPPRNTQHATRTFPPISSDHLDTPFIKGLPEPVSAQILDGPLDELRDVLNSDNLALRGPGVRGVLHELVEYCRQVPRAAPDIKYARSGVQEG